MVLCLIILVFSLIFFIACFDKIEINEYGLLYNTWIMKVEDEPRNPGRFLLGLGKQFIRYPKELKGF
jgi:hypothetical protein